MALLLGTDFEDMIASLTWPCTLHPGWSVEWDGLLAGADTPPTERCLVRAFMEASLVLLDVVLLIPLQ